MELVTWSQKVGIGAFGRGSGRSWRVFRAGCVDLDDQLARCHMLVVKIVIYYVIYKQFWIL